MNRLRFVLASVVLTVVSIRGGVAREKVAPKDLGNSAVQKALHAEAAGAVDARDEQLQSAMSVDPASRDARWQSGMIERDGRWVRFDAMNDEPARAATLAEYRQRRDAIAPTREGHLDLANWCKAHKLFDRERAHLVAALQLSPGGDASIAERLGLKQIDGAWMSDEDIRAEQKKQADTLKDLKTWQPRVQKLADKLDGRSEKARNTARKSFDELNDPAALPALEVVFATADMEKARLLVEVLGKFPSVKATEPLARLAVNSEWNIVRKEAAAKLRKRPVGAFAPELLASMRTPIDREVNLLVGPEGVHLTQQLSSETQSTVQHYERTYSNSIVLVAPPEVQTGESRQEQIRSREASVSRAVDRATILANQEASSTEAEVAKENSEINRWNARVCAVLADATGLQLPAEPEAWWSWWRDYNQLSLADKSEEYKSDYTDESTIVEAAPACECLVAGTPVWTDRGAVAVETVKVGDLVLAKHPESGELSYQAVLHTTVRDPEPVYKASLEQGEIRGTGGHTFWVSGRGWTKLRDIKPNDRLHGAAKPSVVRDVTQDGNDKTYNLVVANFHTYFVGTDAVLSHDLTFARPTDATVPGLRHEVKP